MNDKDKRFLKAGHASIMRLTLLIIGGLAVLVLLLWGAMWVHCRYFMKMNGPGISLSSKEKQAALKSMAGVDSAEQLPLKNASNQKPLAAITAADGTKEFSLTAEPVRWEYQKDKTIVAWAFNGQVPGPEIRVTEGDKVRIKFTNNLPKATTVHWHGLDLPNAMDGVPDVTQEAVKPGESFTYEITATPAGTRFYHTHGSTMGDEAQQSDMGLSGSFIVEPKGYQKPDKEYTVVLDDWRLGKNGFNQAMADMNMDGMGNGNMAMNMDYNLFTINGMAFPDTKSMNVKKGEKIRIRLINASASTTHPMHLHGQQFKITATDGNPVPEAAQLTRNVVTLNPGETYDIEFTANNEGVWAFHCHELHHAGAGMMTLLKYDGFNLPARSSSSTPANMQNPGSDTKVNDNMQDMGGM